tara:strand:- start:572 stop:868 length:297 start_codon:yes stop_codon:yes gene_type:complete
LRTIDDEPLVEVTPSQSPLLSHELAFCVDQVNVTDSLVKIDSLSDTKLVIEGLEGPTGIVSDELDPPPPPQEMIIKRTKIVDMEFCKNFMKRILQCLY